MPSLNLLLFTFKLLLLIIFTLFELYDYTIAFTTLFIIFYFFLNKHLLFKTTILTFLGVNSIFLLSINIYYLIGGDFTSWRSIENFSNYLPELALMNLSIYIAFYVSFYLIRIKVSDLVDIVVAPKNNIIKFIWVTLSFLCFVPLAFVSRELFLSGVLPGGTIILTLFIAFSLLSLLELTNSFFSESKKENRILLVISMLMLTWIAANGFRAPLIMGGVILIMFSINRTLHLHGELKVRGFIFLFFIFYSVLIVFQVMRGLNLTFIEFVSSFVNGSFTFEDLKNHLGGHEQNILYSYFLITKEESVSGVYYLVSLVQVLPSFISKLFISSERVNDEISTLIAPEHFTDNNLNLGAFYLTEAFLNFSWVGVFLIPTIFVMVLHFIEVKVRADNVKYLVSAVIPFAIFYGIGFSLKIIVYCLLFKFIMKRMVRVRYD